MGADFDIAGRAQWAIRLAGGPSALARLLGHSYRKRAWVHNWSRAGIPAAMVGRVSMVTGIPLVELRPDLFPEPELVSIPSDEPSAVE